MFNVDDPGGGHFFYDSCNLKEQRMSKHNKSMVPVFLLIIVAVIAAGCSSRFVSQRGEGDPSPSSVSSASRPTSGSVQTDEGGSVTIEVEWGKEASGSLIFKVTMDTHSVDLDQYDLGKLAFLRDDMGIEYYPVSWNAAAGGHHRSGTLAFPLPDSVSGGKSKFIEMVIQDVAGIEARVLKWKL